MAGFEGTIWAKRQFMYLLKGKKFSLLESDSRVFAVSRSIHYGLFLVFEGIRFFCKKNTQDQHEIIFLNYKKNLERLRKGIAFCLSHGQQDLVPTVSQLEEVFLRYFRDESMTQFLEEMCEMEGQGYFRPFTVDEDQSIGVTFPANPAVRGIICRYERYLGEPFKGVVIPNIVRAVKENGTGCLKLGSNYVISIRAFDAAKQILPDAGAALFLDDRLDLPLEQRKITEWESSCCLFALRDGTIIKIPENELILPSVTIIGICAILRQMGIHVEERDMTYGELQDRIRRNELVAICSVGTAGILNRAQSLLLIDGKGNRLMEHIADESHELYHKLGEAKKYYWNIYQEKVPVPAGVELNKYTI